MSTKKAPYIKICFKTHLKIKIIGPALITSVGSVHLAFITLC